MKKILPYLIISLLPFTFSCDITNIIVNKTEKKVEATKSDKELPALLEEFKKLGYRVEMAEVIQNHYFSPPGQVVAIEGQRVFFYEYSDQKSFDQEAGSISSNGVFIGNSEALNWMSDPHFYKKGKIIIKYVGKNTTIIKALEKVVGKPTAGAK